MHTGRAFSALGRRDEAIQVWEQGYDRAFCQSTDLKQLLELEELLTVAKQSNNHISNHLHESSRSCNGTNGSLPSVSVKTSETGDSHGLSNGEFVLSIKTKHGSVTFNQSNDNSGIHNGLNHGTIQNPKIENHSNGIHEGGPNGSCDLTSELEVQSNLNGEIKDTFESCSKSSTTDSQSNDTFESDKFYWSDALKKSTKYCVARISNTNSINVDFRLSRGIAQVLVFSSDTSSI